MKTYDPKKVVVTFDGQVIEGVFTEINYVPKYARGAVPYPTLETVTPGIQHMIHRFGPDGQTLTTYRCTGRRVPPNGLDPRADQSIADAVSIVDEMKARGADLSHPDVFLVARDAALSCGANLEVISNGQAEGERLQRCSGDPTWRKWGDAEAVCGGLRFVHPNQGGLLSKWHLSLIARLWVGRPLYVRRLKNGGESPKARVWEPKAQDLFGRRPFSEKNPVEEPGRYSLARCASAYCTAPRRSNEPGVRFCLLHEDQGDREW